MNVVLSLSQILLIQTQQFNNKQLKNICYMPGTVLGSKGRKSKFYKYNSEKKLLAIKY